MEHIVIDGESTDGTIDILKKYDKEIIWSSEPDGGQTDAINKGIKLAKGEVLTYLNSDDILLPGAVAAVMEEFDAHPAVDFIYGDYEIIDSHGNHLLSRKTIDYDRNILLYGRALIAQPASFFRRRVIEKIGLFDERYDFCMDIEFWIRAVLNGVKFKRIDRPLAAQRLHDSAKTMTVRWKLDEQHRKILNDNNLLWFKNYDRLNRGLFNLLKFLYRSKASIKRMIQHRDFRLFATAAARTTASK